MLKRRQFYIGTASAVGFATLGARAQTLPGTIRFNVVVPQGASMDNVTRLVAECLRDTLKLNTVVEYKAGGTGLVASQFLKTTEPDASYAMFAPWPCLCFLPVGVEHVVRVDPHYCGLETGDQAMYLGEIVRPDGSRQTIGVHLRFIQSVDSLLQLSQHSQRIVSHWLKKNFDQSFVDKSTVEAGSAVPFLPFGFEDFSVAA